MDSSIDINITNIFNSGTTVHIYLRNYRKQALMIPVLTPIKFKELKKIVSNKFRSPQNSLALFSNGQKMDDDEAVIQLKQNSIVHVVNIERTLLPTITIFFRETAHPQTMITIKTTPDAVIRNIVRNQLKAAIDKDDKDVFLAYLGKPINIFKSFKDQLIENQCEIMVIEFKSSHYKSIKTINHTHESKHMPSIAATQILGPAQPGKSQMQLKTLYQKKLQYNQSMMNKQKIEKKENAGIAEESSFKNKGINQTQYFGEKNQLLKGKNMSEIKKYSKFDPNIEKSVNIFQTDSQLEQAPISNCFNIHAAPTFPHTQIHIPKQIKKQQSQQKKQYSILSSNPEITMSGTILKEKDLIFYGQSALPQTQNMYAGVVQNFKQAFLKKKSESEKSNQGAAAPGGAAPQ